jgi:HSP20 family protein
MNNNILPLKRRSDKLAVRRDYDSPVLAIQDEMNRMFDRFFTDPFDLALSDRDLMTDFNPKVDVSETEKEVRVVAELPGMDEKDIQLSLEHEALVISGEKKSESEEKGKNFHRVERSFGSFSRVIALPSEVEADKVEAEFKKGVLTVTLPKPASAIKQSKKIQIKAN